MDFISSADRAGAAIRKRAERVPTHENVSFNRPSMGDGVVTEYACEVGRGTKNGDVWRHTIVEGSVLQKIECQKRNACVAAAAATNACCCLHRIALD